MCGVSAVVLPALRLRGMVWSAAPPPLSALSPLVVGLKCHGFSQTLQICHAFPGGWNLLECLL